MTDQDEIDAVRREEAAKIAAAGEKIKEKMRANRERAARNAVPARNLVELTKQIGSLLVSGKGAKAKNDVLLRRVKDLPGFLGEAAFGKYDTDVNHAKDQPVLLVRDSRSDDLAKVLYGIDGPYLHAVYGPALSFAQALVAAGSPVFLAFVPGGTVLFFNRDPGVL